MRQFAHLVQRPAELLGRGMSGLKYMNNYIINMHPYRLSQGVL